MHHLPVWRRGRVINFVQVDADVADEQSRYTWYLQTRGKGGKAQVTRYEKVNGKTTNVFLSRVIMGIDSPVKQVYPIDGNPLNLTRANLAFAGERRRIQHRATLRKMGAKQSVPQLGIAPIVQMAGRIGVMIDERNGGYGGDEI